MKQSSTVPDGLVIVDQHAAHERLVLERMRAAREGGSVSRQALLVPDVVELDEPDCDRLEAAAPELAELGLEGRWELGWGRWWGLWWVGLLLFRGCLWGGWWELGRGLFMGLGLS